MSVLIPALFLASGMTAVMIVLYRNLKRLRGEAEQAWLHLQKARLSWLEATTHAVEAMFKAKRDNISIYHEIESALDTCKQAEQPAEAATADTALAGAWRQLSAQEDVSSLFASDESHQALDILNTAEDQILQLERRYNNCATLYNNAGVTFPALLIAKRAGYEPLPSYCPKHIRNTSGKLSAADEETLAEKSPHIMNAYMLWAVGMSDSTMEDSDQ